MDCVEELRSHLRETTSRLQSAARTGLDLAAQNQTLTSRLAEVAQEQAELRQRLDLVERDRRWMQDQSLRVDQVRASLNDLLTKADGNRSRYAAADHRIDDLAAAVAKLRDDLDQHSDILDSVGSARKWASEFSAIQRALADAQGSISAHSICLAELGESLAILDSRRRTHTTDTARMLSDLGDRAASTEDTLRETQAQIGWVASHQRDLQDSLQSVIHEYNTMLNEHEQAIRILGENHAVLESQVSLSQTHATYAFNTPVSARSHKARAAGSLLTPADSAPSARVRQKITRSASPSLDSSAVLEFSPVSVPAGSYSRHTPASVSRRSRDSGVGVALCPSAIPKGESLGDIFANDIGFCSQPSSFETTVTTAEGDEDAFFPAMSRKAASVAGTPSSASGDKPKPRVRPRNSSFSRAMTGSANQVPASPNRMLPTSAVATRFGKIISTAAPVGLGWGNYWEARRHRLQFDIQKRLGLSAAAVNPADPADAERAALHGVQDDLGIED
ncbi:hypothetical protein GGI02_003364 [Coemansia sp. RSA 2322]|nr:hypothetical protein GGI02_003364 [Coemansia sp. RSA 2322]